MCDRRLKKDSYSVDVIKRILLTLTTEGNIKKTALSTKTGLNYGGLVRYLKFLRLLGWINFTASDQDASYVVSITDIGRSFKDILEKEEEILDEKKVNGSMEEVGLGPLNISTDVLDEIALPGQEKVRPNLLKRMDTKTTIVSDTSGVKPTTLSSRTSMKKREEDGPHKDKEQAASRVAARTTATLPTGSSSCPLCGNPITSDSAILEEIIDGACYTFDRNECARLFKKLKDVYSKKFFF
jgi:predicted transcriptional regulator